MSSTSGAQLTVDYNRETRSWRLSRRQHLRSTDHWWIKYKYHSLQLHDQYGMPILCNRSSLRVIQWYTAGNGNTDNKVKIIVAAPQPRPNGLAPIPNSWYGLRQDRVFTTPEADVLIAAAYDLSQLLNGFIPSLTAHQGRHAVLFVGNSPSWIFVAIKEMGLETAATKWSARQLPVSGEADGNLADVKNTEAYYEHAIKNIWPGEIPGTVYVVDSSSAGKVWRDSSVTCLQRLLRSVARDVIKQNTIPSVSLIWQMPRIDYNKSLTGMKEIDSNAIRRLIVEEAVGGDTRGKWPFAWSLAARQEPFPRACINFPHTSWSMSRGEVAELKRAMEQDPAYIACKNELAAAARWSSIGLDKLGRHSRAS